AVLADVNARLGADVGRYSFIVVDLHHLLLAGLPAHFESYMASHAVWSLWAMSGLRIMLLTGVPASIGDPGPCGGPAAVALEVTQHANQQEADRNHPTILFWHARVAGRGRPRHSPFRTANGKDSRLLAHEQKDFLIFAVVIVARETIFYLAWQGPYERECCRCLPRRSQKLRPSPRRKSKSSIASCGPRVFRTAPGSRVSTVGSMPHQRRRTKYGRPAQPSR